MNSEQKAEIIKHIKLGTNEVLYYPYNRGKQPLPLRPISSHELDQCFYQALKHAPTKIADLVVKLKLKLIDTTRDISISDKGYADLEEHYDSIDYWVVYHAMKDFQDEDFKFPDYDKVDSFPKGYYKVRDKMQEIHAIAEFVMNASRGEEEIIKEIFKDEYGREVGYCVYYLNTPLAEISKMTRLQRDYLLYSKVNLKAVMKGKAKESSYIISGKTMTVKDIMERFGIGSGR